MGKMKKFLLPGLLAISILGLMGNTDGCETETPVSDSGIKKASVQVVTGSDGLTVEQRNVAGRLKADNTPGSIKHLYVISAYSGQVILYSTVKGKVTSGGKRLTPTEVSYSTDGAGGSSGIPVAIAGRQMYTHEVLGDDGTYGSSAEYLYWWDVQGRYHQHYVSGGQIVHISDQPIPVRSITINLEATNESK